MLDDVLVRAALTLEPREALRRGRCACRTCAALVGATLLARFPIGINALAVILYLRERTGSFAIAGVVAGSLAAGSGVGAPVAGPARGPLRPAPRAAAARARARGGARAARARAPSSARRPPVLVCSGLPGRLRDPADLGRAARDVADAAARPAGPRAAGLRARLGADRADLHPRPAADRPADRRRGAAGRADRLGGERDRGDAAVHRAAAVARVAAGAEATRRRPLGRARLAGRAQHGADLAAGGDRDRDLRGRDPGLQRRDRLGGARRACCSPCGRAGARSAG